MILGIDLGSSTTDYALLEHGSIVSFNSLPTGKLDLLDILNKLKEHDIEQIFLTGQGAARASRNEIQIPIKTVDEITAIGLGGTFLAKTDTALIVSAGSGTAIVAVKGEKITHLGGTAIGGGTLLGLSQLIFNSNSIEEIVPLAEKGEIENVDLTFKTAYPQGIGILPPTASVSHFGQLNSPKREDLALGLFNMIAQCIATLAAFAVKAEKLPQIVLTGRLSTLPLFQKLFIERAHIICKCPVVIPSNAGISTSIGAALAGFRLIP